MPGEGGPGAKAWALNSSAGHQLQHGATEPSSSVPETSGGVLEIWILLCLIAAGRAGLSRRNSYAGLQASFNGWPGPVFFPPLFNRTGAEMPKQTFHILIGALVALQTKHRVLRPLERFGWFLGTRKRGGWDRLCSNANNARPRVAGGRPGLPSPWGSSLASLRKMP